MKSLAISSKKHPFSDINLQRPAAYSSYESLDIPFSSQEPYILTRKLGRGKYSEVFEGLNITNKQSCAIKILKPVRQMKINREIKILQTLYGGPNIIKLLDVTKDPATKIPSLIFEYCEAKDHKLLFPQLNDFDLRTYIREVLIALEFSHSMGIMHRDIKPHNVLFSDSFEKSSTISPKSLKLIDWGLADFYFPNKEYNVRVASRYYKSPELLVEYGYYDYSLDIWSLGTVFAGALFGKEPFFQGNDNADQLLKIVKTLGSEELEEYLEKYHIVSEFSAENERKFAKKPWKSFVNEENQRLVNAPALDLLDKMLRFDHRERITAKEALEHEYFEPLKKK